MATIASLNIDLKANVGRFVTGMKKGSATVNKFGSTVAAVGKKMATFGAASAAAATAGIAILTKQQFTAIDALDKMSGAIGIATDRLAGLHLAAELGGLSTDQMDNALKRMVKSVADANNGLATSTRAFESMGLSVQKLQAMTPDQQFSAIADSINGLGTSTEKVGVAMDIFGRQGAAALNVLSGGSKGLAEVQAFAEKAGIAVSNIDSKKIASANDAFARMKAVLVGIARQIAVKVAPMVSTLGDSLTRMGLLAGSVSGNVSAAFDMMTQAVAAVATAAEFVGATFKLMQSGVTRAIADIVSGFEGMMNLIGDAADFVGISLPNAFDNARVSISAFASELDRTASRDFVKAGQKFNDIFSGKTAGNRFLKGLRENQAKATAAAKKLLDKGPAIQIPEAAVADIVAAVAPDLKKLRPATAATAGAFHKGSSAAFSAANKNSRNSVESQQLRELQRQNRRLDEIARKVQPMRAAALA